MKLLPFLFAALFALVGMTSCDKRAAIRAQVEAAQTDLADKQALVKKLQNDLQAMPSLGKYQFAGPNQIQTLRAEIEKAEADVTRLKSEKQAAEAVNQKLRQETEAYLSKHSKI
jgi:multidrug resistance efflux pump